MAIAFVNASAVALQLNSTLTLTQAYTPTAGNTVVVVYYGNLSGAPYTCKDNNGNALTAATGFAGTPSATIFYGTAVAGATSYTVTRTVTGLQRMSFIVLEYSGVSSVHDINNALNGSGTVVSISQTTTGSNSFIVATLVSSVSNTFTTPANGIQRGAGNFVAGYDNTAASPSSVTCSATVATTNWAACAIELLAPGGAVSGAPSQMMTGMGF